MFSLHSLYFSTLLTHVVTWPTGLPGHGMFMPVPPEAINKAVTEPATDPIDFRTIQSRFQPAAPGDVRSPCPALNAAANVGVLPRNGRNITDQMLSQAVQDLYNLDKDFADTIAYYGVKLITPPLTTSQVISLEDLQRHGAIEHDASLARYDDRQGNNWKPEPSLVRAFLDDGDGEFITLPSMAKTRARREAESKVAGSPSLGPQDTIAAYGEAALVLHTLGHLGGKFDGYFAPKKAVEEWFLEEKIPQGYTRPPVVTTEMATQIGAKILAAQYLPSALTPASK